MNQLEAAIQVLITAEECPVCNWDMAEEDRSENGLRNFRSPDDIMARRYKCGSEFSVTKDGGLTCRIPCGNPSHDAVYELNDERDELVGEVAL